MYEVRAIVSGTVVRLVVDEGQLIAEDEPLAFTLSIKKAFDGGEKKFQINFVATHYFQ